MDTSSSAQETSAAGDYRLSARRVLKIEADGLRLLSESLDATFSQSIELLASLKGHVVLTGIGKSGHIAHKIAATLSSTGTPAFFVHPTEASHGDLGMITENDAVIALSESGETSELSGVLQYCARRNIPLVAITRNPGSLLGQAARIVLQLPEAEPACPLRLAPTTSTTMMLALGDAIAIALLEKKGFSHEDFKQFHPGGKLGRNLLRVQELMHGVDTLPLVSADTPMLEAILEMSAKGFGCVGVVDDAGVLSGVITDGDLRRNLTNNLVERDAAAVMSKNPVTVEARLLAVSAVALMNERRITTLFVVDRHKKPVGLLHIHDCLKAGLV